MTRPIKAVRRTKDMPHIPSEIGDFDDPPKKPKRKTQRLSELVKEAHRALVRLTNNHDPDCFFCRNQATPDGKRHLPECIVSRLEAALIPTPRRKGEVT